MLNLVRMGNKPPTYPISRYESWNKLV